MISVLPEVLDSHGAWAHFLSKLSKVPISRLQRFWIYAKRRGFHGREGEPAWEVQKTRALAAASLGFSTVSWFQNEAWTICYPPGLGKEQHIQEGRDLQCPFPQRGPMDPDLELTVDALVIFGPRTQQWRVEQESLFECST